MPASEVIKRLQELIKEHGDQVVWDMFVEEKILEIDFYEDIFGDGKDKGFAMAY